MDGFVWMAQAENRGLIIDYSSAPSIRKTWTTRTNHEVWFSLYTPRRCVWGSKGIAFTIYKHGAKYSDPSVILVLGWFVQFWADYGPVLPIFIIFFLWRCGRTRAMASWFMRFHWSHNDSPQSIGLLWTSDQLVAETSTWQHTTLGTDSHPCPRRDSNPQSQQASSRRPTP